MKQNYRIIRIPEDFIERMRAMAIRENLDPELAELIAKKLIEMSMPEDYYNLNRIAATSPWLTTEEAAIYMKRSRRTVDGLISKCKIPVYRFDARPMLKVSDIDAHIESKRIAPIKLKNR